MHYQSTGLIDRISLLSCSTDEHRFAVDACLIIFQTIFSNAITEAKNAIDTHNIQLIKTPMSQQSIIYDEVAIKATITTAIVAATANAKKMGDSVDKIENDIKGQRTIAQIIETRYTSVQKKLSQMRRPDVEIKRAQNQHDQHQRSYAVR